MTLGRPPNEYDKRYTPRFRRFKMKDLEATDGELTPEEFAYVISKIGVNHVEFCRWLGLNRKQGRRYASGIAKVPKMMGKLLILMVRLELTAEQV